MTSDHQQPITDGDGAGGNGAGASGAGSGKPPAIALEGICKSFGPVQANRNVTLRVMPGTIHGIVGENGAGKSTLLSILYGFYQADAGEILVDGASNHLFKSGSNRSWHRYGAPAFHAGRYHERA